MGARVVRSAAERLWARVEKGAGDECWLWLGGNNGHGYGVIGSGGRDRRMLYVHRVAYEDTFGPIPEGLAIDHLCNVRNCVNPRHLKAVTARENVLRASTGQAAQWLARTECGRGHPFDEKNTGRRQDSLAEGGSRYCRACAKEDMALVRQRYVAQGLRSDGKPRTRVMRGPSRAG